MLIFAQSETAIKEILKRSFAGVRESPSLGEMTAGDHFMGRLDVEGGIVLRRVQVTEAPGDDLDAPIKCVDIDSGDALEVPWYNLFLLKDEAMGYPRQVRNLQFLRAKLSGFWDKNGSFCSKNGAISY